MANQIDYAALSAIAYNAARGTKNILGLGNWKPIAKAPSGASGFNAQAYRNVNDVVIAFTGTNFFSSFTDVNGNTDWGRVWGTGSDFLFGNIPAAIGIGGQRLLEGAQFYQQAKAKQFTANLGRRYA
jgi:hypothetical protein